MMSERPIETSATFIDSDQLYVERSGDRELTLVTPATSERDVNDVTVEFAAL